MDRIIHVLYDVYGLTAEPHDHATWINISGNTRVSFPFRSIKGRLSNVRCMGVAKFKSTVRDAANYGNMHILHFLEAHGRFDTPQHGSIIFQYFSKKYLSTRCTPAFVLAAKKGHLAVCQFLRPHLLSCDKSEAFGGNDMLEVMLPGVAAQGHVHILQFLKDSCDVRVFHLRARDALIHAAGNGHANVVQLLKEWRDAPVSFKWKEKWGPQPDTRGLPSHAFYWNHPIFTIEDVRFSWNRILRAAAAKGHLNVLQFLKNWRDDTDAWGNVVTGDRAQLTVKKDVRSPGNHVHAFQLAAMNGHVHILEFLKDWRDEDGTCLTIHELRVKQNFALRRAAKNGHVRVLQFLRDWRDPSGPVGGINGHFVMRISDAFFTRLTVDDVRSQNNYALRKAGNLQVFQFLTDWLAETSPDSFINPTF